MREVALDNNALSAILRSPDGPGLLVDWVDCEDVRLVLPEVVLMEAAQGKLGPHRLERTAELMLTIHPTRLSITDPPGLIQTMEFGRGVPGHETPSWSAPQVEHWATLMASGSVDVEATAGAWADRLDKDGWKALDESNREHFQANYPISDPKAKEEVARPDLGRWALEQRCGENQVLVDRVLASPLLHRFTSLMTGLMGLAGWAAVLKGRTPPSLMPMLKHRRGDWADAMIAASVAYADCLITDDAVLTARLEHLRGLGRTTLETVTLAGSTFPLQS